MALSAGTVVADRFEIRAVAGRGGMSVVYRALDRSSGAEIALKVTDCDWEAGVPRFAREARVLSELLHPGIVRYLGHGATPEGDHYLAMEWLDGEDLSAVLRRRPSRSTSAWRSGAASPRRSTSRTATASSTAT
ncbi:MAG: protein kinase [Sandaracinaceae bacterium]|nr:protein kinase [Sandaracinaceae bacterium]